MPKPTPLPNLNLNKVVPAALLSVSLLVGGATGADASDGKAIGLCLLDKCRLPLAKCITNPNCLANVACIQGCASKEDEIGCQIKCGDLFENTVVGEFNKCAVSQMACVPQRPDDGSYPVPSSDVVVKKFPVSWFDGPLYITSGQNELFDRFPCQLHLFTSSSSTNSFYGSLNWRISEPDGEFLTRDAVQRFKQDSELGGHMINHDNEYLHYQDDWYIIDWSDGSDGVDPFAFVYYRGSNDAWDGYGGAFVYTKAAKFPESIRSRCREAAKKVRFDFDKDFADTDNTCKVQTDDEKVMLREKFVGKELALTEEQLQRAALRVRGSATNSVKAQKIFFENEGSIAGRAVESLKEKGLAIERAILEEVEVLEKDLEITK
ncbi:hypothetical protein TrVE_jg411 [Triparma verrucosa]|uniref:VDE lipocalin domain-containing protein n=1 Tax=Triparma verrucosa TaxID=1606542 RepID=A0A9W7F993_9STRA|nr:hypothetical protein TrVE_jg411 [Triparma verrucosa]